MNSGFEAPSIRRIPYPYRSLLAICSDLDETPNRDVYWETLRYLNTTEPTAMGPGLGLEVGNTIYFDMPPSQFAYWTTDDRGRAEIHALVHSGHVDCLHSFGDFATTRKTAAEALEALSRHGCAIRVWIDHAVARTNFGADIMRGEGDVPGSPAFHADLTHAFGVRFVWRGRVTSVIGQDATHSLAGVANSKNPFAGAVTTGKEVGKRILGSLGSEKYRMNARNQLLRPVVLRSGHRVVEFLRSNPSWAGVSRFDNADGLAEVLTTTLLNRLADRGSPSILYTHLGKVSSHKEPLQPATREALKLLADAQRQGLVLVTTTRRLLDYWSVMKTARVEVACVSEAGTDLDVTAETVDGEIADARALMGLTVYIQDPERTRLRVKGTPVAVVNNAPDITGRPSLSIPWARLDFPRM